MSESVSETLGAWGVPDPLVRGLEGLPFVELTETQRVVVPRALTGRDLLVQAPTGTGKTLAFGLPLLRRVRLDRRSTQGLVVCPTRELCEQIGGELRRFGRFLPNLRVVTLSGGVPARAQLRSLEPAPHVVVGTPGRLNDHLRKGSLDLAALVVVVLDEADRMLDMGFRPDLETLLSHAPAERQTLLFSATYPPRVLEVSRGVQRSPEVLRVAPDATASHAVVPAAIEHAFFETEGSRKLEVLMTLLAEDASSALVFVETRRDADDVAARLRERGVAALALHGELERTRREEVLLSFEHRSCPVLVATDLAARGLDVEDLGLVISWEPPRRADVYVHRAGRTGRAGRAGRVLTLCSPGERARIAQWPEPLQEGIRWPELPPSDSRAKVPEPAFRTVRIEGGRRDKLRPGDLLGAFGGELALPATAVGKISVGESRAYASVSRDEEARLVAGLQARGGKLRIKGKTFRAALLDWGDRSG